MANVEDSSWISASDAVDALVATGTIDTLAAKAMLADYLRDGRLSAKAKSVWINTASNAATLSWKIEPNNETVERDVMVPVRYWRSDKRALEDRSRWRWPTNQFYYTITVKPLKRRMFSGVRFDKAELHHLLPQVFAAVGKAKRGRPPEIEKRDAIWTEVVRMIFASELTRKNYPDQLSLTDALMDRLRYGPDGKLRAGQVQIREVAGMAHKLLGPADSAN
ncbi:hypothetical protein OKW76_05425 [Sphingomonas sp. S1-29]|uniref:hypothetical protein n=1 Tax=Sphingomonas sp. S1-29 TaxID=2991074 RepID=UPI00224052C8|nr:hypothetical protein [Sphingomonas sp. S1-29]UZK70485.1 hypothetical protein OKW76_05425 [Sphingomonas sp. S1-29]